MTLQAILNAVRELSPQDRESLKAMIDGLSSNSDHDLTDAEKAELLRRRDANRSDPSRLIPRETVSARMNERGAR